MYHSQPKQKTEVVLAKLLPAPSTWFSLSVLWTLSVSRFSFHPRTPHSEGALSSALHSPCGVGTNPDLLGQW